MPALSVTRDLQMHYEVDDFTAPWSERETILLMHGNAESGEVWYAWVPHLASHLRVVRPDMRGFGRSTPMPRDYPWCPDRIVDDYIVLMDHLGVGRFHVVGAKVGGTMALHLAARHPSRVQTLTVLAPPIRGANAASRYRAWLAQIEQEGVESWARSTMAGRLGPRFPSAGTEWWIKLMGRTALTTQLGFIAAVCNVDVTHELESIRCPTLVVTTEDNPLYPLERVRAWQIRIPDSALQVIPGDSYHLAATEPEQCARTTLEFVSRHRGRTPS